jgi:hypothetical protein
MERQMAIDGTAAAAGAAAAAEEEGVAGLAGRDTVAVVDDDAASRADVSVAIVDEVAVVLAMRAARRRCERRSARWRLWLAARVRGTAVARQNCRSRAIGMTRGVAELIGRLFRGGEGDESTRGWASRGRKEELSDMCVCVSWASSG